MRNIVTYSEIGTRVTLTKNFKVGVEEINKMKQMIELHEELSSQLPFLLLELAHNADKMNGEGEQLTVEQKSEEKEKQSINQPTPNVARVLEIIKNMQPSINNRFMQYLLDNNLLNYGLEYGQKVLTAVQINKCPITSKGNPSEFGLKLAQISLKRGDPTAINFALIGFGLNPTEADYSPK